MKRSILFCCFLIANFYCLYGQDDSSSDEPLQVKDGGLDVLYKSEKIYGGGVHRIGFQGEYRILKRKTYSRKRILSFEILTMQHPKEIRKTNPYEEEAKSYRYGKLNALILLRSGISWQKIIAPKESLKNIEIKYNFHVGPSLASLKPVYLNISKPGKNVVERYDENEHEPDNIIGKASFMKGIGEMKFIPGIYTKVGLNFDFSPYFNRILAIEVGLTADVFLKKLQVMAFNQNENFILSYYISVFAGKKYYQ